MSSNSHCLTLPDELLHDLDVAGLDGADDGGQGGEVDAVADGHVGGQAGIVQVDPAPAELVGGVHEGGHGAQAPRGQAQRVLRVLLLALRLKNTHGNELRKRAH